MGTILNITTKTGNYTATPADEVIVCSGTFTVTLPTAVGITGKQYDVKNTGVGLVTVATTSSQLIDGESSMMLPSKSNMEVVSDGTGWRIL